MIMEQHLNLQLVRAAQGRELWLQLVEEYNIEPHEYVILFPSSQREVNSYGLLYLNQFMDTKRLDTVVLLTNDQEVHDTHRQFAENVRHSIQLSDDEIESLLYFYRLYMFTNKLIIVALDQLPGRSLAQLQNVRGITLEELVAIGIYQLREFKQER